LESKRRWAAKNRMNKKGGRSDSVTENGYEEEDEDHRPLTNFEKKDDDHLLKGRNGKDGLDIGGSEINLHETGSNFPAISGIGKEQKDADIGKVVGSESARSNVESPKKLSSKPNSPNKSPSKERFQVSGERSEVIGEGWKDGVVTFSLNEPLINYNNPLSSAKSSRKGSQVDLKPLVQLSLPSIPSPRSTPIRTSKFAKKAGKKKSVEEVVFEELIISDVEDEVPERASKSATKPKQIGSKSNKIAGETIQDGIFVPDEGAVIEEEEIIEDPFSYGDPDSTLISGEKYSNILDSYHDFTDFSLLDKSPIARPLSAPEVSPDPKMDMSNLTLAPEFSGGLSSSPAIHSPTPIRTSRRNYASDIENNFGEKLIISYVNGFLRLM
jgi:hypothetical protein